MRRCIIRRAVDGGGRLAHDVDIAAEIAVDDTHKWMGQRRRERRTRRRRDHDDMSIDRNNPVVFFGRRLSHRSINVHDLSFDVHRRVRLHIHPRSGFDLGISRGCDLDVPGVQFDASL